MEEQKQETIFADGIFFNKPHENAPDFVKGSVSFKVEEVIPFLQKYKKEDGYVNIDLLKSREGKLYFKLNTFKPKASQEETERKANLQSEIDKRVPSTDTTPVVAGEDTRQAPELDESNIPF